MTAPTRLVDLPLPKLAALLFPLLAIGLAAGAARAIALRSASPRGRRALQALWVLLLLAGVPLWLVLAAAMRIW